MGTIYISYGITKSASTFAWQLIKRIAIGGGLPFATLTSKAKGKNSPGDYIDPVSEQNLNLLREDVGDLPVVIKTHGGATPAAARLVAEGAAQVFASYRDLRDAALSLLDHGARSRAKGIKDFAEFHELSDTIGSIDVQVQRFDSWVKSCAPLLISYDEICFDTRKTIFKIANSLSVSVDVEEIFAEFSTDKARIGQFNIGRPRRFCHEMTGEASNVFLDRFHSFYERYYPEELHRVRRFKGSSSYPVTDEVPLAGIQPNGRGGLTSVLASELPSISGDRTGASAESVEVLKITSHDVRLDVRTAKKEAKMSISQDELDSIRWFHSIDFGNGTVSKGFRSLQGIAREADIVFEHGVSGKAVLDIGAWDGAFSFEAEKRGASRVVASDHFCWVGAGWGKKRAFDLAKRALRSNVEEEVADVFDLNPDTLGIFDIVLFLGVLYHLKDPLRALEHVAKLTRDLLVLETETALDTCERPAMVFFPGKELNNDPTNWWAPNVICLEAMLTVTGFRKIEFTPSPSWDGKINERRGRFIFHAWKQC